MSHMVWRFEYTIQKRIEALRDILVQQDTLLPSHVRREWFYHAQLVLEPVGWNALWRLPRDSCQQLGVRFPCVVYVMVEGLELNEEELAAHIEVIGVQDDSIHLPERSIVPLQQLWATISQPNSAIEVKPTAKFIDLYRYFYTLIWMPWDLEDDEHENGRCWFQQHVPARCNMWATAFTCKGFKTDMLYALRDEGEIIRQHILRIEEGISSDNEDSIGTNKESVSTLVSLHERLQGLRARWELLQNPALQCLWNTEKTQQTHTPTEITLVWKGGPIKEYINCLNAANEWLKYRGIDTKKAMGCSPSLIALLDSKPDPHSILLLCEGIHILPRFLTIGDNYKISSVVPDISSTVLRCADNSTTALTIYDSAELSNLTIDATFCSTAITVRSGCLVLNSCAMSAPTNSPSQSTVVFENGEIIYKNCTISGFFTGIVAHAGSKVKLVDCVMKKCGVMLQVYEGANVILTRCQFIDYPESGIRYESSLVTKTLIGGIGILNKCADITIEDCKFTSKCNKNDVCITHLDEYACPQLEGEATTI